MSTDALPAEPAGDHPTHEVLKWIAERYYYGCAAYEAAASGGPDNAERVFWRITLITLQDVGDRLAEALKVSPPDWECIRDIAAPVERQVP